MKYLSLIRNTNAYKTLERDMASGNFSHAYLLHSSDYLGLEILTKAALMKRFCAAACGGCRICQNIQNQTMADIMHIGGEKVLTADADMITSSLLLTPTELSEKVYVVGDAKFMNEAAQNKLLKSLEEPPPSVKFFLLSSSLAPLLPTVKSRCRMLELKPFGADELDAELSKYYSESARRELAAAQGSIARAEETMQSDKPERLFGVALRVLAELKSSRDLARVTGILAAEKQDLETVAGYMMMILRDCLAYNEKTPRFALSRRNVADIISLAQTYNAKAVSNIIPKLNSAQRNIKANFNVNAIIDGLLFMLLEERYNAGCNRS